MVAALFKHPELYVTELFHAMAGREIKLLVKLAQLYYTYLLSKPQMVCFPHLKLMYVAGTFKKKPQEQSVKKKNKTKHSRGVQTRE